jgi:hypothetical protein
MDYLGVGMGICLAAPYLTGWHCMDVIENIALMSALLLAGVGITVVVLIGFIYFSEFLND